MSKFKVGDRVRLVPQRCGDFLNRYYLPLDRWNDARAGLVVEVAESANTMENGEHFSVGGWHWPSKWFELAAPLALTKDQRAIAKAKADLAKLEERAALKAKQAADRKAKAERAKALRGLSAAGKRVVAMLQAGSADDFGCQRENVIKLVAAITGDKPDAIKRAVAH